MTDIALLEWETLEPEQSPEQLEAERLRLIDVTPLKKMVDDYRDGTVESRLNADKARRYYDGDQVFGQMATALRKSRQPKVIRNEVAPAVNGILGVIQQGKTDPKAYPRNPENEKQADVATKVLRFIADMNKWHDVKVDCAETFLIEGVAGVSVEVNGKNEPLVVQLPCDELIYDPRSRRADFADSAFNGLGKWMYEGDLARMYPLFREDLSAAMSTTWGAAMGLDREDKPANALGTNWMDPKRRRVFVVEIYHLDDGAWKRSVFYVGGVLEDGPSPYLDEEGQGVCGIILQSCLVTRDNQRCGVAKAMLSIQDEINSYGSRSLHLARSRQIQVADANFPPEVSAETAKEEAAKPDGAIPAGWAMVPTVDLQNGMQMMMADARQALVRQAPTPAVLAEASGANQSGRSRLVLQQAGMTEIARTLGRLATFENNVFRACWQRARQFKTEPWYIRVSGDDDKKTEFEGVNIPTGPDGQPIPPEMAQMMAAQGIQVPMANKLADMDIDIEVEAVPDTANLAAEQFETLAPLFPQLAEAYGAKKAFEVGVALSSLPEKQRIKDILNAPEDLPPEQQAQAQQQAAMQQQMQQMAVQLQQAQAEAQIAKDQSTAALNMAKAMETQAKARDVEADTVLKAAQFQLGQPIDAQ